jgi:hypothetical protein
MAGAPKGNKNALKHGLYAKKVVRGEVVDAPPGSLALAKADETQRGLEAAIRYLQDVMDVTYARLKRADGEEFARLANTLSLAATALFNGYRTVAYLTGGIAPVDEALKELQALGFEED